MGKGKDIVKPDIRVRDACRALRYHVEHPNERPDIIVDANGLQTKDVKKIYKVKVDGVEIGYQVLDPHPLEISPMMVRNVYIRFMGYKWHEVPREQKEPVFQAICDELLEVQQEPPVCSVLPGDEAVKLSQAFLVLMQFDSNPNLVSIAGGLDA